jgi:hypothetical protein
VQLKVKVTACTQLSHSLLLQGVYVLGQDSDQNWVQSASNAFYSHLYCLPLGFVGRHAFARNWCCLRLVLSLAHDYINHSIRHQGIWVYISAQSVRFRSHVCPLISVIFVHLSMNNYIDECTSAPISFGLFIFCPLVHPLFWSEIHKKSKDDLCRSQNL